MKKAALLLLLTLIGVNAEAKNKHHHKAHRVDQNRVYRSYPYNYQYQRNQSLPPGLAKRNGNLPPGLERQEMRRGQLPPGLEKRNGYPVRIVR